MEQATLIDKVLVPGQIVKNGFKYEQKCQNDVKDVLKNKCVICLIDTVVVFL